MTVGAIPTLKYFRKHENYVGRNPSDQRGFHGPVTVASPQYPYALGLETWFQGGVELGYPIGDSNGPQTESFTWADYTQRKGRRVSSFKGYVQPILSKPGSSLKILIQTQANRILFEGNRAVGVKFTRKSASTGETVVENARARKEIIVCAGVVDSPTLLMRSGVGPKSVLNKANIPVVKQLPVGRDLHDHALILTTLIFGNSSSVLVRERDLNPESWRYYQQTGEGPYSSFLGTGSQAFLTSSQLSPHEKSLGWSDLHLLFLHTNASLPFPAEPVLDSLKEHEIAVRWALFLVRPKSRGSVTLNLRNIDDAPNIDFQYLAHPDDIRAIIDGLHILNKLCEETSAFQHSRFGCRIQTTPLPGCSHLKYRSHKYWECYARQLVTTGLHAGGTCQMGSGPEAVVDTQLRVIGIEGLRVVDASIMPAVTNANTQGAVYVIAEKAADMILRKWDSESFSHVSHAHPFTTWNSYYNLK